MSDRTREILVGLIATTLFVALVSVGVKVAFGAFRPTYDVEARFAAAGQGLIPGSDVKIRGVNVGEVRSIELDAGRALVILAISQGEAVPVTARATIRPKTLFGEKFVDIEPGPDEGEGPFLAAGDEIVDTLGGFELEEVLTELHPILKVIDPVDIATILGTLAGAGDGLGESINRTIVNFQRVTAVQARRDAETRQFLEDFADLSEELARRAEDLVAGARDLNVALPEINRRSGDLAVLLDQTARLSSDLADLLDANRPFLRKSITEGGKALQVLFDEREQIGPLVTGLRQYAQLLAEAIRIELGDGTLLAAVKSIPGGDICGQGQGSSCLFPAAGSGAGTSGSTSADGGAAPGEPGDESGLLTVPKLRIGAWGVVELLEEALR